MESEIPKRTIQVVIDEPLIEAAKELAQTQGITCSALIRKALRLYVNESQRPGLEAQDRKGYSRFPDTEEKLQDWEEGATWPS